MTMFIHGICMFFKLLQPKVAYYDRNADVERALSLDGPRSNSHHQNSYIDIYQGIAIHLYLPLLQGGGG